MPGSQQRRIGGAPQDLKFKEGTRSGVRIGLETVIREHVTIHRATQPGGWTEIGRRCLLMSTSHVAHDCRLGDEVIVINYAGITGHCEIGDFVFIGGLSAVHQFTRIGPQVMVGGVCGVRDDIIPFGLVNGQYAVLEGLNIIGMKRRKFTRERLATVRAFYQKLFHGPGIFAERLQAVQGLAGEDPAIAEILDFIAKGKHRPLCLPATDAGKR